MKIGILTHPLGTNYGGILQNYALQSVLKSLGYTPITLNYYFGTPFYVKTLSYAKRVFMRLRGGNAPLRGWPTDSEEAIITQYTHRFIHQYINTTEQFSLNDTCKLRAEKIDAIVVGSDQVWRGNNPDVEHFYLSDFQDENIRKVAYAASFGVDFWEYTPEKARLCSELIKKFSAVSVREMSGAKLCKEHFGVDAKVMLDPTLLIDKSNYEQMADCLDEKLSADEYVMTYILDQSFQKKQIIQGVAKSLNAPFYTVMAEKYFREVGHAGVDKCIYPPVEKWIRGFRDSKFVVTDSFHGTVFSILFHKQFVSIVNSKRGTDRFVSLLSMLHLEDRLVDNYDSALNLLHKEIDYAEVDQLLAAKKTESIDFIKENLK